MLPLNIQAQTLTCDNKTVEDAFNLAVKTLYKNTCDSLILAGGTYGGEWVRDVSINSWNAAALLIPKETAYSLWSVTIEDRTMIGHQYWDHIIWTLAAYDYYIINNDLQFLRQAYIASKNTMAAREQDAFDSNYGLFTGPSVFNDGIAGYEEPIYNPQIKDSYVLAHPESKNIKCLSTNCLYFQAYKTLALMAKACGDKSSVNGYEHKAKALKTNIRRNLYDPQANKLYYLIDGHGTLHKYQEGLGHAFAILFGVVNKKEARSIIKKAYIGKYGLPSIYPAFKRFKEHPGRHNQILWPFVGAFWADACHSVGMNEPFLKELFCQADMAININNHCFYEVYNENTGKQDGGWQIDHQWESVYDQTWSATGYIRMILYDVLGMRCTLKDITFHPDKALMKEIGFKSLNGLKFRGKKINIGKRCM